MGLDDGRQRRHLRAASAITLAVITLFTSCLVIGSPSFASAATADLSATLTNKVTLPGHRVSYVVEVTNHGPSTAKKVQIDFFTSQALQSVEWVNPGGRCIRSPSETACLFGTMKAGTTRKATISGVIPKKAKKGAAVTNKVVLGSDTHLTNTTNDTVTDNYRIGFAAVVPTPKPSPSPSASTATKLDKITNVASDAINVTHTALTWSVVALGAAAAWFAVGLTLKARKRRGTPSQDY